MSLSVDARPSHLCVCRGSRTGPGCQGTGLGCQGTDRALSEPDQAVREPDRAVREPDRALSEPDQTVREPDHAVREQTRQGTGPGCQETRPGCQGTGPGSQKGARAAVAHKLPSLTELASQSPPKAGSSMTKEATWPGLSVFTVTQWDNTHTHDGKCW